MGGGLSQYPPLEFYNWSLIQIYINSNFEYLSLVGWQKVGSGSGFAKPYQTRLKNLKPNPKKTRILFSGQKFSFGPFAEVILSYNGILDLSSTDWH